MRVSYIRELKHNYMKIETTEQLADSYECRMLIYNSIENILKIRTKYIDDQVYLYYEITSKQPLKRILEIRNISFKEIRQLFIYLSEVINRIDKYLLKENLILLDPEYIYVDPENFSVYFCLYPGEKKEFVQELRNLLQYILGKVDHNDKESVVMSYGLYQETLKENYGMDNLMKWLVDTEEKKEEKIIKEPKLEKLPECVKMEEPAVKEKKSILPVILIFLCLLCCPPAISWLLWGNTVFSEYFYFLVLAELFTAVIFAAVLLLIFHRTKEAQIIKEENDRIDEWQMEFDAVEEMPEEYIPYKEPYQEDHFVKDEPQEEFSTVLLTNLDSMNKKHFLRPLDRMEEEIVLNYFPFIIGKQQGITDYILAKETVSRIHVKIEEQNGEYLITDLNSTNGTFVNGTMLQANERVSIKSGDEIMIADQGYVFY